jgi:hypothetical protein
MGGVILLLLLGTQILDWPWVSVLLAAALAAGGWKLRQRLPSGYATAQGIDRVLGLEDTLSTAYYFRHAGGRKVSPEVREAQYARAEQLAAGVAVEKAVPFSAPKSLYAMAALGLVASSLFALRYGVSKQLDLRPPLAKILFDAFQFGQPQPVAKNTPKPKPADDLLKQFGLSLDSEGERTPDGRPGEDASSSEASETVEKNSREGKSDSRNAGDEQSGEKGEPGGESQPSPPGISVENQDSSGSESDQNQSAASNQESKSGQQADSNRESNSLMDKFRDAMANLLSRLTNRQGQGDSQQSPSSAQARSESGQPREGQAQKGAPMAGKQSEGQPDAEGEGDQEGEGQQQAQSGAGKQGGRDSQQSSREGKTGIGKEDGSKDVREAEQLAAMGKISELIGKRSQELTGEVMVEVASGKQQLRTAYSQQSARHAEAGGEIHRDEIPLAYQRYVEQYFQQIRKAPAPAAPAPTPLRPEPPPPDFMAWGRYFAPGRVIFATNRPQ